VGGIYADLRINEIIKITKNEKLNSGNIEHFEN
jgi:hypothetical protein